MQFKVQNSSGLKISISCSPSVNNLSATDCTLPADFEPGSLVHKIGEILKPTNLPIARIDNQDAVYKTNNAKIDAAIDDIKERNNKGQPILVGTVSVESSEEISRSLTNNGIKHSVLNAKNHEEEASIISQAGRLKAVTVATNMAGRGVDIKLGGNSEEMALLSAKNENKVDDSEYIKQQISNRIKA